MKPTFFETPAAFRRWLKAHHRTERELWVGFYKKATGRPTITYAEALDEALCVGWIDGVRKSVDEHSYTNRFSPRRPGSNWSTINIRRAKELLRDGRMLPAGKAAFEQRAQPQTGPYSMDWRKTVRLTPAMEARFRENAAGWKFFGALPPGARQISIIYVMSAKRPETQDRRLQRLIETCAAGRRLDVMSQEK